MIYGVGPTRTDTRSSQRVRSSKRVNLANPVLIIRQVNNLIDDLVLVALVRLVRELFLFGGLLGVGSLLLVFLVLLLLLLH